MKAKLNFRSVVFKRAYRIVKETDCTFSAALVEAWKRYRDYKNRIVQTLSDQINTFDFYYNYSDDGRVYRYWSNCQREITQSLQLHSCFISAISSQLNNSNNIQKFI